MGAQRKRLLSEWCVSASGVHVVTTLLLASLLLGKYMTSYTEQLDGIPVLVL